MQRMRPDIPPEPIQPDLTHRRPRARDLKHARRDAQRRVGRHHLRTSHPLGPVAARLRGQLRPTGERAAVRGVQFVGLGAGAVGEGFGGAQVREEGAVGGEDVEFVRGRGFRLWRVSGWG